jgi:hypothetical protein
MDSLFKGYLHSQTFLSDPRCCAVRQFFSGCPRWGANPGCLDLIYFLIPSLYRWTTAAPRCGSPCDKNIEVNRVVRQKLDQSYFCRTTQLIKWICILWNVVLCCVSCKQTLKFFYTKHQNLVGRHEFGVVRHKICRFEELQFFVVQNSIRVFCKPPII